MIENKQEPIGYIFRYPSGDFCSFGFAPSKEAQEAEFTQQPVYAELPDAAALIAELEEAAEVDAIRIHFFDKEVEVLRKRIAELEQFGSDLLAENAGLQNKIDRLEARIAGGVRVYVDKLCTLGWVIGESEQANATLLLDEQGVSDE